MKNNMDSPSIFQKISHINYQSEFWEIDREVLKYEFHKDICAWYAAPCTTHKKKGKGVTSINEQKERKISQPVQWNIMPH